jgi:GTPase-activating protein SST2
LQYPYKSKFQPTRNTIYQIIQKGKDVVNITGRERPLYSNKAPVPRAGNSNIQKLDKILNNTVLYLLFRENLRDTYCKENLLFYLDIDKFLKVYKSTIKAAPVSRNRTKPANRQGLDSVKGTIASVFGIYNTFLVPGSPCKLNIDYLLRNQLVIYIIKAVGQDTAIIDNLKEVAILFEEV